MNEFEIINIAIEKLHKNGGIEAIWEEANQNNFDGKLTIFIKNEQVTFNVVVKKELRNHQLTQLDRLNNIDKPILLIAERIFPNIKKELREREIAYLEANGNIFIRIHNIYIWLETQKPIPTTREKGNRAFTKTGLKVLFHFLIDNNLVGLTYRQIANITNVGLGNVNNIFTGLKETGFLLKLKQNEFILNNKKELLEKWVIAYREILKPTLEVGRFRFAKEDYFNNWRNIQLQDGKTWWGGEPAGDLLTNHLRPGELTLYTIETRNDLIKNYRMIPDQEGDIRVYKKFWDDTLDTKTNTVPTILIYTDLINVGDKRCRETAEIIFTQYVEPNL
jgi:hypothetical protein